MHQRFLLRRHCGQISHILHGDGHAAIPHRYMEALPLKKRLPRAYYGIIRVCILLDHIQINPWCFVRGQGQQILGVFHQCDRLVCRFPCPAPVSFAADDIQSLHPGDKLFFAVQPQRRLGCQNSGNCLVQPLECNNTAVNAIQQEPVILVQILVKEDHICPGGNRRGDGFASRHGGSKAHHGRCVCRNQAVEAQLLPEQTGQQGFGQTGGQEAFLLGRITRKRNMTCHHRLSALIDQILVNISIGFVPLLSIQGIDAGHNMLVTLVYAVAGKMLDGHGHMILFCAPQVGAGTAQHLLRIRAEGTNIGNGIVKIHIDVHDGRKTPVESHGRTLRTGGIAHAVGILRVLRGGNCHRLAEAGAFKSQAVTAAFRICRQKQRNGRHMLNGSVGLLGFCSAVRAVHHTANADVNQPMGKHMRVVREAHRAKHLSGFLRRGHGSKGAFHPSDSFLIQKKRICGQVNHNEPSIPNRRPGGRLNDFYFAVCRMAFSRP